MKTTFQIHLNLHSPEMEEHRTVEVSYSGLIMRSSPALDEYVRTFVACKDEKYEYQVDPDWWRAYRADPKPCERLPILFEGDGRKEVVATFGITGVSLFYEFDQEGEVAP